MLWLAWSTMPTITALILAFNGLEGAGVVDSVSVVLSGGAVHPPNAKVAIARTAASRMCLFSDVIITSYISFTYLTALAHVPFHCVALTAGFANTGGMC
jgi:hypothetical protein